MRFNPATLWTRNYAARFRPMAQAQADGITMALYDSMQATEIEINEAVASICSAWSSEQSPNIHHIADAIRTQRGITTQLTKNHVVYFAGNGERMETTMKELKSFLVRGVDPAAAWDIICTPIMTEQCRELQKYCDDRRIAYERFTPENAVNLKVAQVAEKWSAA